MRRTGRTALLASVALVVLAAPTLAHHPGAAAPSGEASRSASRIVVGLRPGDTVSDHGISLIVPARGERVWGELKFRDGSYQQLAVRTSPSGVVSIRFRGDEAVLRRAHTAPGDGTRVTGGDRATRLADAHELVAARSSLSAASAAPDADASTAAAGECRDRYHRLFGWRIPSYSWRFRVGSTPRYLRARRNGIAAVLEALKRSNRNIVRGRNSCGMADRVGATFEYLGATARDTGITRRGSCGRSDGRSVVAFGRLPLPSIAMACVYGISGGRARDADLRINTRVRWETGGNACNDEMYLEPAITHEFGHIYGLGHASAYSHRRLTMHPYVPECTRFQESLGLGDLLGLRRKY